MIDVVDTHEPEPHPAAAAAREQPSASETLADLTQLIRRRAPALAAERARGRALPAEVVGFVVALRQYGLGPQAIAEVFRDAEVPTSAGGQWRASTIVSVLTRAGYGSRSGVSSELGAKILELRAQGATLEQICSVLNGARIASPRGGIWHPSTVSRILPRLARELGPPVGCGWAS